jgi:hypothetical protein
VRQYERETLSCLGLIEYSSERSVPLQEVLSDQPIGWSCVDRLSLERIVLLLKDRDDLIKSEDQPGVETSLQ